VPRWQGGSSLFKAGAKARQLRGKHKSSVYHLGKVRETRIKKWGLENMPDSCFYGARARGVLARISVVMPSILLAAKSKT
jgi:hypothetical protein